MIYSRIDLSKTDYQITQDWLYIINPDITMLNNIYVQYCRHKKFKSVMPIFDSEYTNLSNDVIGYRQNNKLVAFSIITKHDRDNIEAVQFAWDYKNPELRLGIESLKNECAIYKARGFKYLYLGEAAEYKNIDGYELLGPI